MTLVVIIVASGLFFAGLHLSRIVPLGWTILEQSAAAVGRLNDASLDDDARERVAREMSLGMLALFARIAVLTVAVAAAPAALLWASVAGGVASSDDIWAISTSWPFLVANVALFAVVALWPGRK